MSAKFFGTACQQSAKPCPKPLGDLFIVPKMVATLNLLKLVIIWSWQIVYWLSHMMQNLSGALSATHLPLFTLRQLKHFEEGDAVVELPELGKKERRSHVKTKHIKTADIFRVCCWVPRLTWPKNRKGSRKVRPLHIHDWKPSEGREQSTRSH